uniref:RUN and SH3 domain containing 1 n=1 Tax=Gouania willdenowi TaxID=441366 RepID=A0A8C5ET47_GOUWI
MGFMAVSSPPLSLAQSSQPYFLHSAIPAFRPGYCPSHTPVTHRPDVHDGQEFKDKQPSTDVLSDGFSFESLDDLGVDSPLKYEDVCNHDTNMINNLTSDLKSEVRDIVSDSLCNFDSLYSSESDQLCDAVTESGLAVSDTIQDPGCTTPYKNIEVMMKFSNSVFATDSLYSTKCGNKARTSKELPPLPSYYLYHPKNCPLHRGAPPRLSPIGALSPPHRSGAPSSEAASSTLSSPLFPRSYTLPALTAPLYYPNLYPPIPLRAPPLPPKLYQAPLQSHVTTVRSVSLAGLVQKAETQCEGEDVKHPRRAPSLSAQCLQEKRALVGAVSVAVEAILAQFSSSRTVVQKTLSGDSTINPSLGRLVLQCLCPALHSLLTDGSKPHQSDLIAGRRPNSPWGLVQASTRPGPKTQLLFNLQVRVSELPQLRQSKHRFNAFLLGLLNSKLLDSWLLHLQSCSDVLNTFYLPTSFMRLSLSTCKPMFDELLLVLQPLSLLTFNLDLLFQHHHLEPERHVPQIPAPLCRDSRLKPSPQAPEAKIQVSQFIESLSDVNFGSQSSKAAKEMTVNPKIDETSTMTNGDTAPLKVLATVERTSPQLLWVQEKEMVGLLPPNIEEESLAQQAGQVFQQGWGAVIRWGGRLSQNLSELSLAAVKKEEMIKADQPDSDYTPVSSGTPVPWGWGRLFGATKSPNSPTGPTPPTRRPSQWLAPGVTALTRMVSSSSAPTLRRPYESQRESETESEGRLETEAKPTPPRSVRTLCEHTGTGSELSFCKGEELVVLGGVDQDWIRCRQGDKEGLVPIGYTSLIM